MSTPSYMDNKLKLTPSWMTFVLLLTWFTFQLNIARATTPLDLAPIPQLCDGIVCPPDAEMQCPEDSSIRELREMNVDLIGTNAVSGLASLMATTESSAFNSSLTDDDYAQCCLSKKCVCKTCYIRDCNTDEGEVVVELQPEAMDTPGQCCGNYECQQEPNCTEVRETEFSWLQSCQRCSCKSGTKICEQSCDESNNAICESKNLNTFFKNGESWVDGCYHCQCVKGEEKCTISFCGSLNCPSHRQVMLKDSCCPICWPKDAPMPNSGNYDEGYGYEREHEDPKQQLDTLNTSTELPTTSTTTTISSSIPNPSTSTTTNELQTTSPSPCQHDFANVVEVVHPKVDDHVYFVIIGVLIVIIAVLYIYIRHLLAKQRSYRPVSNFDDKV
ncbi:cysteine-rich motor neuron 1 protein [Drosophila nasuta]|uniref:cysteine-rich motor neuron 1 protein n=1 Tax=Drosophila nasuta TaxID=42062 RepID=UPI00295ECB63|nr:cysteine-rich motor neuron 1 protein [Drosophila nasuta]